jgi:hypothetical protein
MSAGTLSGFCTPPRTGVTILRAVIAEPHIAISLT